MASYFYSLSNYLFGNPGYGSVTNVCGLLETAMLNQGWTILDDLTNGTHLYDKVWRTPDYPGLAGYYAIVRIGTNYAPVPGGSSIALSAYSDWDSSTHLGALNTNWPTGGSINIGTITGTFQAGEIVSDSTTGARATVATATGVSPLLLNNVYGSFLNGDSLTGLTSGATATATSNFAESTTTTAGQPSNYNSLFVISINTGATQAVQVRANPYSIVCFVDNVYLGSHDDDSGCYLGWMKRFDTPSTRGMASTSGALSSGGTVINLTSDLTGTVQVGQWLLLFNYGHSSSSNNFANSELVKISAVGSFQVTINSSQTGAGPTVAAHLQHNYDSGAILMPYTAIGGAWSSYQTLISDNLSQLGVNSGPWITGNGTPNYPSSTQTMASPRQFAHGTNQDGSFITGNIYAQDTNYQSIGLYFHILGIQYSSSPVVGSYTDGNNVYYMNEIAGSGGATINVSYAVGPTGDTPNFATMSRCMPPTLFPDDTSIFIPQAPPAASTSIPVCGLNQGLD